MVEVIDPADLVVEQAAGDRHRTALYAIVLMGLPAVLFGRSVVDAINGLQPLATSPSPWFVPGHWLLLYVAAPLVVLSACALLLAPGLIVARRFCRNETPAQGIVTGFTLSFMVVSTVAAVAQALFGTQLVGPAFGWLVLALSAGALALPGRTAPAPITAAASTVGNGARFCLAAAMVIIATVILLPKLFWENFNGDGAHMFEVARLLLRQPLPFWSPSVGDLATFPGIKSMLTAYPPSWFIRLFGSNEAGMRLPYLLLLAVLFFGMIAVIEDGLSRRMRTLEQAMLAGALLLFTLVMAFSATEDFYQGDLALPAVQDVLLMIFWCGFMLHFRAGRGWPMAGFIALAYLTSPNALPLLGAWLLAALIVMRPLPRRPLVVMALAVGGIMLFEAGLSWSLAHAGLPGPGSEHGTGDLLRRLVHPQFSQVARFAWAFVPVGLLPGLALVMSRWQDRSTRLIAACAVIMFAFYYFQYRFALHYFVPVMILSLVVLWRTLLNAPDGVRRFAPLATGAATLLGLDLSWPSDLHIAVGAREVGEEIEDRVPGYESGDPAAFANAEVLQALFPRPSDPRVPAQVYGGHPLVWLHYAHVPVDRPHPRAYVLQRRADPPVAGARLIADNGVEAVYVRDEALWAMQAARRLPDPLGSRLYVIPRTTLFTTGPRFELLRPLKEFCQQRFAWCLAKRNSQPQPAGAIATPAPQGNL